MYLRPPNIIIYDTGKNFINKEFKQYAIILKIAIKSVPIKAYNLVRIVKHYCNPLYCIYYIITIKLLDINKDITL
jgi:hypothetical protein